MGSGSRIANLDFNDRRRRGRRAARGPRIVAGLGAAALLTAGVLTLFAGGEPAPDDGAVEAAVPESGAPTRSGDRVSRALALPEQSESASAMRSAVLPPTASQPSVTPARPDASARDESATIDAGAEAGAGTDADTDAERGTDSPGEARGDTQAAAGTANQAAVTTADRGAPEPATRPGDGAADPGPESPPPGRWETLEVTEGDNLAALFNRAGLTARDVHEVVNAGDRAEALTRLFPGDIIRVKLSPDGDLLAVRHEVTETETLHVDRAGSGYTTRIETREVERRVAHRSAVIKASLFHAGARVGLSDDLIMELAGIFAWDVDFALDIRRGDAFTVIYEELYRDGEKLRNGEILAAEFVNQGEVFRAVRYTDPDGRAAYYAPDGRSMRRAFLRTPVNFARVSSNFNPQRLHPVLGKKRPHMGTDYAARTGTPIKASGDGRIIHRGRKGGYGRTVVIRHGTRYTTLYAHMSGYKSGLRVGSRVSQGDVIGYVGASGLATGPHLHYEFRIDGVHRNPRTVELPEAEPIPERLRADFEDKTQPHLAQLRALSELRLASADTGQ